MIPTGVNGRGGGQPQRSEDQILADELAAVAAAAGGSGRLTRFVTERLKKNVHEIDLVAPLPFEGTVGHVAEVLKEVGRTVDRTGGETGGDRQTTIRVVAGGGFGSMNPVVVTASVTRCGETRSHVSLRAAAKEGLIRQRAGEQTATRVSALLNNRFPPVPENPWFDVEEFEEDTDITEAERAFVSSLRDSTALWASEDVFGGLVRAGEHEALVAYLGMSEPDTNRVLIDFGVHFHGERVRGDRLHNQLFELPDQPSHWALDTTGTVGELARRSADWFHTILHRPVVLYVWLHDGYAYAARYAFADRDETLTHSYDHRRAPRGQAEELTAAGHVHGRGWIQTTGLPTPTLYLHIRGDLATATLPPGTKATTRRGPIGGVWYE